MDATLTAEEMIECSQVEALQFQIALLKYKMPRVKGGLYGHPFRVKYSEKEGLFIYAESFTEDDFDEHITQIFSELMTAVGLEKIVFTYSMTDDEFYPMSHYGGKLDLYRDGTIEM